MIVTLPAPFEKTTAGFDEQAIKSRGWKLWSSNQSSFNGRGEMLVHFEQSANGSVYLKWLRAFGDQTKTTIVTATFLKDQEQAVSAVLRATVLSAQVDSGKSNDSSETTVTTGTKSETNPFGLTLGESSKLKLAPAIANALLYTTDGTIPIKSPSEPLFVVVPVNVLIAESERESYAEQRVSKTADFKNPLLKSNESIELAGLSGFETIADGTDAKSGTPLVLYQVVLFEDNRCLVLQGMVGAELADEYLPEFQKLSRGLQRPAKPSPKGRK